MREIKEKYFIKLRKLELNLFELAYKILNDMI
jgi:hypothetical protein